LNRFPPQDPAVLVAGAIGEDAAVLDPGGPELLVAKTDPITFASVETARYLLAVNSNDLAVTGAEPRWLLVTVLLPEGCTVGLARDLLEQLGLACQALGVSLVGGHTEVTVGLDRPILVGCLLGLAPRERWFRTAGARAGDAVVLAGGVAIEGTAILAREHSESLRRAGVPEEVIQEAAQWLESPGISVLPAARLLWGIEGVHALHDPTEGGLATALHEIADAAGVGLRVQEAQVPVLPPCRVICEALGLDPLGLLASGALLATLEQSKAGEAIGLLQAHGLPAAQIGTVVPASAGRVLVRVDGATVPLPRYDRDELARFLSEPRET